MNKKTRKRGVFSLILRKLLKNKILTNKYSIGLAILAVMSFIAYKSPILYSEKGFHVFMTKDIYQIYRDSKRRLTPTDYCTELKKGVLRESILIASVAADKDFNSLASLIFVESSFGKNMGKEEYANRYNKDKQKMYLKIFASASKLNYKKICGSNGGAIGPAQIKPGTFAMYSGWVEGKYYKSKDRIRSILRLHSPSNIFNPYHNVLAAALHLKEISGKNKGKYIFANYHLGSNANPSSPNWEKGLVYQEKVIKNLERGNNFLRSDGIKIPEFLRFQFLRII